ncbi:hypothetical protein RHSIM_Rhsim03G0040700 [Rhododendron simsii]|uniref:Dirigent protein n=1 Tax=Rhododendron simsii TaxID=118357 RepID=A0A834LTF8_RHOSS|nr:hypothetical protein RHSIM_Rhsim03G0040700 [Rhododendron simsii]
MAAAYPSNFLLLVLVVATASIARASLTIFGTTVDELIISGVFTYPSDPTVNVAGAKVGLSYDGGLNDLGEALSGPTGAYTVAITTAETGDLSELEQSKCGVYVTSTTVDYTEFHTQISFQSNLGEAGEDYLNLTANILPRRPFRRG